MKVILCLQRARGRLFVTCEHSQLSAVKHESWCIFPSDFFWGGFVCCCCTWEAAFSNLPWCSRGRMRLRLSAHRTGGGRRCLRWSFSLVLVCPPLLLPLLLPPGCPQLFYTSLFIQRCLPRCTPHAAQRGFVGRGGFFISRDKEGVAKRYS